MLSRRELLNLSVGASVSGWFGLLADRAQAATRAGVRHKSCILLWMAGGPAQSHTFDVKPRSDFKAVSTAVPGIQISEHLPLLGKQMKELAIIRSMKTGDGNHQTASYLMHTGFRKGQGGVTHPSMGALVSSELGQVDFELPNFVAVGNSLGSGFLGPRHAPLVVRDFKKGLPDLAPPGGVTDSDDRASLVEELDRAFLRDYAAPSTRSHTTAFHRAVQLMKSGKTRAFDLSREPAKGAAPYGTTRFGQGCLLARRLVEEGVPFVEVSLGGWDTHNNTPQRIKALSGQIDRPWAALIDDLKQRGLLDSTLVVWMGEFGRTPGHGKNHFAKAWSSVLAGAGLKTGQVVGGSNAKGTDVTDHPVNAGDFMATICKALGIDYTKQYRLRNGRPMQKVAKEAKPVAPLFA